MKYMVLLLLPPNLGKTGMTEVMPVLPMAAPLTFYSHALLPPSA